MAQLLEYNATLIARVDLEPSLAIFTARPDQLPETHEGRWFIPGQYVTIGRNRDLTDPLDLRPPSVRRPMSIASAPERPGEIEFYIRRVATPESELPLTHVIWPMQVGDRLYLRPHPTGKFTVADTVGDDDRRLKVFVAAGTGLAPFVSMARSRVLRDPKKARLDDFAIVHGASHATGLGYRDELETWVRNYGLRYVPTISRPHESPGWEGFGGRVESLFAPDQIDATEGALGLAHDAIRPERAVILICGLQGTIANTVTALLDRGYVPDNRRLRRALGVPEDAPSTIFWEQYDTTPVIDHKDETLMASLRQRWLVATPLSR